MSKANLKVHLKDIATVRLGYLFKKLAVGHSVTAQRGIGQEPPNELRSPRYSVLA